jgi:hypothetical protein
MDYKIDNEWTALSVLTGVKTGDPAIIQNIGRAGDLIEVIISAQKPLDSDRGLSFGQITPLYKIEGNIYEAWLRYIRYDLNGTITPKDARTCLVSIQSGDQIIENDGASSAGKSLAITQGLDPVLSSIVDSNNFIADQLKLLNARIEEAFETRINLEDVTHED